MQRMKKSKIIKDYSDGLLEIAYKFDRVIECSASTKTMKDDKAREIHRGSSQAKLQIGPASIEGNKGKENKEIMKNTKLHQREIMLLPSVTKKKINILVVNIVVAEIIDTSSAGEILI
ncbi:uncharacterized protein LOC107849919 [Capsicum annuum]|uniref:uncharacterized protein LOC107849919 n=1 Tax=Capsicum annuum TaxID=4072 RepID=UPI0007BEE3AD|nr:uncharacterized protein LOC107849919 [Capsicum annuum]